MGKIESNDFFLWQDLTGEIAAVSDAGLPYLTVRIASLLVTLPTLLLTVTAKTLPLSRAVVGGVT